MRKTKFQKMLIVVLLVLLCANFIFPNFAYATSSENYDPLKRFGLGLLDGILGLAIYPLKLAIVVPIAVIRLGTMAIAGEWGASIYNIFFNQIDSLNINIFKAGASEINTYIASFYIAFRNLAIVLSLAILIYIGIRMAISSIAEDKAKYKQMLTNWFVGFGLIFVLHIIIIFVINANEILVNAIGGHEYVENYMGQLLLKVWAIPFTTSFASIVMYVGLTIISLIFLVIYIKRYITVLFLIMIAPLISITYSADKIGNNKSEILNTWLREFLYNVLIQPFHCVIYSVFIVNAMDILNNNTGSLQVGAMIYAIILTFSIFFGQKIIREIFGFKQSRSLMEKFAIVAIAQNTAKNVRNVFAIKGARNDRQAKKAEKRIGKLGNNLSGGEEINGANLVELRKEYEEHNRQARRAAKGKPVKPAKVKRRRPLKNAPKIIKRTGRFYRKAIQTGNGYNKIRDLAKKRRQSRTSVRHLNAQDMAMAMSQSYRKSVNPAMDNATLQSEFNRINSANISTLTGQDLVYRLNLEALKTEYGISDKEIRDAILYGSNQNRRWRG